MIVNFIILIVQLYILFLQVRNFLKFHLVNGANKRRWLMIIIGALMTCHVIRNIHAPSMWFLLAVTLLGVYLYDGYNFIWDKIKRIAKNGKSNI